MISIIVTAYKEEKTIGKAIEAILDNKIKENYEVLVVAPDKETLDAAKFYSKKNKKVKLIQDSGDGKPAALNMIFKKAKGDILILTDGDVFINNIAIASIIRRFEDKSIGAVSGRPISLNNKKTLLGYWSHLLSDIADKRRKKATKMRKRMFCSGYLYAMRKGIIKEIPTETLSEDGYMSHLMYEAGYKIAYAPEAEVYIKYPTRFKDWIIQKRRSTGGYNQIKMWIGKEIRSLKKETSGVFDVLKYARNFRELFYTFILLFARLYLWAVIFIDVNIKKKELKKIWLRASSTK